MDAVEFIRIAERMRSDYDEFIATAKEAASIIEQCGNEYTKKPVKTRQGEFLKMFPNAAISNEILCVAPCDIEGKRIGCANGKGCNDCRREYWLTEVTDND